MAKMSKKAFKKNQKMYKMKGCSKKTRKNYLGGFSNINLAYPSNNIQVAPNPYLAYTSKGGSSMSLLPVNTNALDKTIPNTGPPTIVPATPFLNPSGPQKGGCGCGISLMKGGKRINNKSETDFGGCGPLCASALLLGGSKHRIGCKCSECKMKGGQLGGNPYPNGLVGSPWTPQTTGLPGVNGVQGGSNYLAPNNYHTDVQTSLKATGANPPFSVGGRKKGRHSRKQKGGNLSNFLSQDLINLGRQFQFGVGTAYNALSGYSGPVNPLPWKGQMPNTANINTIKAASI